jgi:glycosyltransferase involved in cell wall biosynthesis
MMSRADLFVLTSWDEAFGLVYTEAMAQGTPVIACRGEGPADFVEDGVSGFLVPPRDPAALARVIGRVLDDPDGARRVGEAGRGAVADLTWAGNAARQIEIYAAQEATHP